MKVIHSLIVLCGALTFVANATVTIGFNNPFVGGVSSNLANSSSVATNGLLWGIIVDTDGTGFKTNYAAFTVPLTVPGAPQFIALSDEYSVATTNVLILADSTTYDTSGLLEGDIVTPGGDGGVSSLADIPLTSGVTQNDAFRLVWFDQGFTSSGSAGYIADATFLIPADSASVDFDAPFVGIDPIRPATGITFIPEPSAALMGVLGSLALLRRRRVAQA